MIFRLLILFLIIWFLIWLIKKQFIDPSPPDEQIDDKSGEDMIPCDYCGTHAPKSLIVKSGDKQYCCKEHAQRDE